MKRKASTTNPAGDGQERATTCRSLAVTAEKRAAQTRDPDVRTSFLSMKELWLDLAEEIDRRGASDSTSDRPQ